MTMHTFRATLIRSDTPGAWTYVVVPFHVKERFGTKSRVPVTGTVNGFGFRGSLMPQGGGRHYLVVNGTIREAIGVTEGDEVEVTLKRDDTVREVDMPDDFGQALAGNPQAWDAFDAFSYSHRKEYVDWINGAKKTETRTNRIEKAIGMLANKQKLK